MQSIVTLAIQSLPSPSALQPVVTPPSVQVQTIRPDESWLQYWPIAAIIVGSLILLAGLYLIFLIWKAKRKKAALESAERRAAGAAAELERERRLTDKRISSRMRHSFKEAVSALKAGVSGRDYRYQVPWFLMVGENDSGKSTLLDNAGLAMPLGKIGDHSGAKGACDWYFYSEGLMLNVNGNAFVQSDGSPAGGKLWKHILRQLSRRRPERPIDGIVLAIPATDLLAPLEESRERIRAKSDAIYQRIVEAQKSLGLCFPVYVVITKCDQITGFREFGAALPDRFADQIFGWSSPYTLETAFNPRWTDEAINGMDARIYEMQSEIFAENNYLSGGDELFLFPAEFQKIAEPLKEYLSGIFKQSVYHETIFLRGVYFSGSVAGEQEPEKIAAIPTAGERDDEEVLDAIEETTENSIVNAQAKPFFIRELLEQKIFPEWRIARPASRIALHQNRTIRAIQLGLGALIIGWGLWLWKGYDDMLEKREILLPFLEALKATDADEIRFARHASDGSFMIDTIRARNAIANNNQPITGQGEKLRRNIFFNPIVINKFVQYANNADATEIWSFGMPASWPVFTRLHGDITECMRLKYRKFILDVFREKLSYMADDITTVKNASGSGSDDNINSRPDQMREYEKLISYGADLNKLGKMIVNYNDLTTGGKGDLDKVTSLMEYLFRMSPSEGFKHSISEYFAKAVNKAKGDQIITNDYQAQATEKFENMMGELTQRIIHKNPINGSLDDVGKYMNLLVRFDPALNSNDAEEYGGLVDKLNESIAELQRNLDRPEYAWVFDSVPTPLRGIFTVMKNSSLVSAEKIDLAERRFTDELLVFQSGLITRRPDYFETPLLTQKEGRRYRPSDEVLSVKKALASLLTKEFMRTNLAGGSLSLMSADIQWNLDALNESARVLGESSEFITKTIPTLENIKSDLRQSLEKIARFQIELDMRKRITDAQRGFPSKGSEEATIKAQIQDMNDARTAISSLLLTLRQQRMNSAADGLANSAVSQMQNLLQRQWVVLEKFGRYDVDPTLLNNWEGETNLSKAVFRADNADALIENMKIWRNDISTIVVKEVQPMLSFLQSSAIGGASGSKSLTSAGYKFQTLAEQLDRYEKKIPGNSVSALENFMLTYLDSIKYYSDYRSLTKSSRDISTADDYFSSRLAKMKKSIRDRCDALVNNIAVEQYRESAKYFGDPDKPTRYARLSSRFPFVQNPAKYDGVSDEARPDDIRDFYTKFGSRLDFVNKWLQFEAKSSYYDETVNDARIFIREMMYLQNAFRSYLESDKPDAAPAFDIMFDYRVKLADESGSQDIVEWKVQSGGNTVTNRDPSQRLRWEWGSPVTVSLRWANNGDIIPVKPDSSDGVMRVEGRSAVFEFGNKWSLIQMMKAKEPTFSDEEENSNNNYSSWFLKFDVKTKNAARSEIGKAKVYMRMRLFYPGSKEPVPLSGFINLPYKAAKLETKILNKQ